MPDPPAATTTFLQVPGEPSEAAAAELQAAMAKVAEAQRVLLAVLPGYDAAAADDAGASD